MMYFCTLFDSNYASKGIAMYLSLEKQTDDFVLYVMGMDRRCHEVLSNCGFKHLIVECIDDVFTPELAKAQSNRSRAEFCWTCGAYFTDYFLHKYSLPEITYLDSDLMFFGSPKIVLDEFYKKNASVGLAPHFTKYPLFGKYCVQFVYFKNDDAGSSCLRWWRDQCLHWCYCKMEDGKYADQKYLDYFAEKFDNVRETDNRGVGIAEWNVSSYQISKDTVKYRHRKWPIIFFHYSGFSISIDESKLLIRHTLFLTKSIRSNIVDPYIDFLYTAYSNYLLTPITSVSVRPVNSKKNVIKGILHYMGKLLPVNNILALINRIKYREKRVPYNEPKE